MLLLVLITVMPCKMFIPKMLGLFRVNMDILMLFFGYCAFEYWILKENETEGYYRISREELADRLWEMIQEDYQ